MLRMRRTITINAEVTINVETEEEAQQITAQFEQAINALADGKTVVILDDEES